MFSRAKIIRAGLLLLVTVAPAFAQSHYMFVDVPFAFTVGKKMLPAGKYVVSSDDLRTYMLRERESKQSSFVLTNDMGSGAVKQAPCLVFLQAGSRYALSQIWTSEGEIGHSVLAPSFKSKDTVASAKTVEVLAARR